MPVVHSGETDFDKELQRWNTPKRQGGMNADGYEPYPRMLYRAWKRPDGRVVVLDDLDPRAGHATARDEQHAAALRQQGYHLTVQAALDAYNAEALAIAHDATRVAFDVSKMSPQAQQEYAQADAASSTHVLDVPAPKKKRRPHRRAAAVPA